MAHPHVGLRGEVGAPGFVERSEAGDDVGVVGGEVVALAGVGAEVGQEVVVGFGDGGRVAPGLFFRGTWG